MSEIFSLDLETASNDESNPQFALEPFRFNTEQARITDISIVGPLDYKIFIHDPSRTQIFDLLNEFSRKIMYMHNSVFDTAWLYAILGDIEPLKALDIRDTMLLAKWLLNSQREQFKTKETRDELGGLDLKSLVKRFLSMDLPGIKEFLEMKEEDHIAGDDEEYWSHRAIQDTHFTRLLAIELQSRLPEPQRNGFLISQKQIPYVARAWVEGAPFDWDKCQDLTPKVEGAKIKLAGQLGLDTSVIQSPAQLSDLLFNNWGLTPLHVGKTGRGSTAAGDLKMIALRSQGTEIGEKMKLIMKYKKLQTLQTKYLNGFQRVVNYVGKPVCHGSPRIFGTYTGRYTYASKTQRKQLFQISIAMHQLPRLGPAKALMTHPEGKRVGKYDASGQEIAFMAWASGDVNMLAVLNQGMNVHSWMATNLTGEDYVTFLKRLHSSDTDAFTKRLAAKLLNLSCQYRIGWAALQAKFFETYDIIISRAQSNNYLGIYKKAYPGVPDYWKDTVKEAQEKGYAETIAGRRYYLTDWDSHRWATESSAINTPVQGSGADQKDLIIWLVSEKFPEVTFIQDIHDEGVFYLPEENAEELNKDIVHFLNDIDYEHWWKKEIPMPLVFEGQLGDNFKECTEYAQSWDDIVSMRKTSGRSK